MGSQGVIAQHVVEKLKKEGYTVENIFRGEDDFISFIKKQDVLAKIMLLDNENDDDDEMEE